MLTWNECEHACSLSGQWHALQQVVQALQRRMLDLQAKALEAKRAEKDKLADEVAKRRKFIDGLSAHMQVILAYNVNFDFRGSQLLQ